MNKNMPQITLNECKTHLSEESDIQVTSPVLFPVGDKECFQDVYIFFYKSSSVSAK